MTQFFRYLPGFALGLAALATDLPAQTTLRVRPVRRAAATDTVPANAPARSTATPTRHPVRRPASAATVRPQGGPRVASEPANVATVPARDSARGVMLVEHDTATPTAALEDTTTALPNTAATPRDTSTVVVAAAEPSAVPAPAADVQPARDSLPAVEPRPAASPAAPAAPAAITIGTGTVKFSGMLQAWYLGGSADVVNTFRVRRAEMKFAGAINPRTSWTLLVDLAKSLKVGGGSVNQASLLLQDAFMTLKAGRFAFDVGQMKLPATYEGSVLGASSLETIDNALFISDGKAALVRDLGVVVSGPLSSDIGFRVGLFNGTGEGQNTTDLNDTKAVAGRVELKTVIDGFRLGASGVWSGPVPDDSLRRDRVGLDARFVRGPLTLRGELLRAWDADKERLGYYALGAWRVKSFDIVARHDVFDRAAGSAVAAGFIERDYLAGINYRIGGDNVRLQANYVFRTFDGGLPHREIALFNVQTAW